MLDAELNYRYWGALGRRYYNMERACKIFLALMASSAVAGWGFFATVEVAWKTLSATSAVLAVALPIVNLEKSIKVLADLTHGWYRMFGYYEQIWLDLPVTKKSAAAVNREFAKVRKLEVPLVEKSVVKLPHSKRLARRAYEEVLKSRNLEP